MEDPMGHSLIAALQYGINVSTASGLSSSFFLPGEVKCPIYRRTRDSDAEHHMRGRLNLESFWQNSAPFVDKDAQHAATQQLPPVFWELYLADTLIRHGKKLVPRVERTPRNKGPDLLIEGPRVWVEAIMPDGSEDLTQQPFGQAYEIPDEAYLLRLTSAIEVKVQKFLDYRKRGYIKESDATIIAVSATKLNYRFNDLPIPRIISAVFAAGHLTLQVNLRTREVADQYLAYRESIEKNETVTVRTDMFLRPEYSHISALLYSPCDWINPVNDCFILIHNPLADISVPRGWLGVGREYWLENSDLHFTKYFADSESNE